MEVAHGVELPGYPLHLAEFSEYIAIIIRKPSLSSCKCSAEINKKYSNFYLASFKFLQKLKYLQKLVVIVVKDEGLEVIHL